ncbi:MAG: hypothetical protein ACREL7_00905 [Longimicrobiales bacterium]
MQAMEVMVKCAVGLLLLLVGSVAVTGCGDDEGARGVQVVRRDSAGVEIVENHAEAAALPLEWRIDTVPAVDIGQVEGDPTYELFRVTGTGVMPDGNIVVLNGGTQELRFYDERGSFVDATGGSGEGPGEYQFPFLLAGPSYDTLHIFDRNRRLSFVALDGTFVRSWTPRGAIARPIGMMSPGRLITRDGSASARPDTPEGMMRDDILYEIVDLESEVHDTVALFEGQQLLLSRFDLGDGRLTLAFTPVPLDVAPSAAVTPGFLFVTPGKLPEVLVYDSTGALRRIFRLLQRAMPVMRQDFDRAVDALVAEVDDAQEAAAIRRRHERMPLPESMPVFRRLLVDEVGHVWVEKFDPESNLRHDWIVIDPTGRLMGHIVTPAGVTMHQIGRDYILGHTRDELDIEHVVRYKLSR